MTAEVPSTAEARTLLQRRAAELVGSGMPAGEARIRLRAENDQAGSPLRLGEVDDLLRRYLPSRFADFVPLDAAPVPGFPRDVLPHWLGDHVEAQSEATQTPLDLAACVALAAVSTAIHTKVDVLVKPGYREPVNVYVGTAMPPGSRKSTVFEAATRPLVEWEKEAEEAARETVAIAAEELEQLRHRIARLRRKAAGGDDPNAAREAKDLAGELSRQEATAPRMPRILTDDSTPETLATLMGAQDGRIAIFSPEGGELFEMAAGRYSGNGSANLGIYLKGHAGDMLAVDRKRERVFIERPSLVVMATFQPGVLRTLQTKESFRDRGLLARFLFSVPASRMGSRSWRSEAVPESVTASYRHHLRRLLALERQDPTPAVALADDAREAWLQYAELLEPELGDGRQLAGMTDWAGKLPGAIARLAGVLHAAEWADQDDPFGHPIDLVTMERALALGAYFMGHATAAFRTMASDPRLEGAMKCWRSITRAEWRGFTKRELFQRVKGGRIQSVDELDACLRLLAGHGYVAVSRVGGNGGTGGTPRSEEYEVNPEALAHEAQSLAGNGGSGGTPLTANSHGRAAACEGERG